MGFFTGNGSKVDLEWESISNKVPGMGSMYLYRTKVPGGWLVMMAANGGNGVTFVPDASDEWIINPDSK